MNWYTYANNNPLLYVDPLGLAAFVTKQEYKGQDIYNYIALGRGGELSHNLLGFIPGAGFVNWLARNTGGIAEITGKDWKDYIIESGSNLSDLASMTKHFKSIPHSSKISEAADKVSTGLNLTNLVLFMSDTEFIRDQLVGQIGGLHMAASTKEGVIVKYGYLRDRIDELIESKELTYSCSFFGLGNVNDYKFQTEETKEKLILELMVLDADLVLQGMQTEEIYHNNFAGYLKERELVLEVVKQNYAEMKQQEDVSYIK